MQRQGFTSANIEFFERSFLENIKSIETPTLQLEPIGELSLYHLSALPRFWEEKKPALLYEINKNMLSGLHEAKIKILFSVTGGAHGVEILFGSTKESDQDDILVSSLINSFHGAEITPKTETTTSIPYPIAGIVTGTPSRNPQSLETLPDLDVLTRGICNKNCGITIIASPLEMQDINKLYNMTLNEMRLIQDASSHLGQENPVAIQYKTLLQKYLEKLDKSKQQGLWTTTMFLYAETKALYHQLAAVIKSAYTGKDSIPDQIRTIPLSAPIHPAILTNPPPPAPGVFKWPFMYSSKTSTEDLAMQIKPPSNEFPGYKIKPYVRFNLAPSTRKGVNIGEILDQGHETGHQYIIPVKGLKKHGLIIGGTGSGKTNTVFYILRELLKEDIPFMVLEPAKTEYRNLLHDDLFRDKLQVYTLGDNTVSPFRLNPFHVYPDVLVQTHIDFLKSVFNASFHMWGPLPQILEQCLVEVYTDRGWDLASNQNRRGVTHSSYPTLTDLYNKVDQVVSKLGYSPETNMELKSSLKTRLNSLRIGGKGLMLDTNTVTDFGDLLSKPTVLELESIGDDDEKGFLMGLIFTMLYEYYLSQGLEEEKPLNHLTIIEEAHRLLGNTSQNQAYTGDMGGKAVEIFTNILSEIRAYGEGLLIVDQIPSKLSPDVIKNTNLKIMHRTVSDTDRNIMASSMTLKESNASVVSTFKVGRAAVFSEGDDGPYHVKVPYAKLGEIKDIDEDETIKNHMQKNSAHLAPYVSCNRHCQNICIYKQVGQAINQIPRYSSTFPSLLLSLITDSNTTDYLSQLFETGNDIARMSGDNTAAKTCAAIQGAETYFKTLGARYHWSYRDQDQVQTLFQSILIESLLHYLSTGKIVLNEERQISFTQQIQQITSNIQPTKHCIEICTDNTCQYRYLLDKVLEDEENHDDFVSILNTGGPEMWNLLLDHCKIIVESINPSLDTSVLESLALCYGLQKAFQFDEFNQTHITQIILNLIDQRDSVLT